MMSQCLLWVHFSFFLLVGQVPRFSLFPGILQQFPPWRKRENRISGTISPKFFPNKSTFSYFFQFLPSFWQISGGFCWFLADFWWFPGSPSGAFPTVDPRGPRGPRGPMASGEARGAAGRVAPGRGAVALGEDAGAGRLGGAEAPHHAPRRETRSAPRERNGGGLEGTWGSPSSWSG